jgi:hypothetical protein
MWDSFSDVANVSEEPAAYIFKAEVILKMTAAGSSDILVITEESKISYIEGYILLFTSVKTPCLKQNTLLLTGWMQ